MLTRWLVSALAAAAIFSTAHAADKAKGPAFRYHPAPKPVEKMEFKASFYDIDPGYFGPGRKPERITLEQAIAQALANNLDVKFDRIAIDIEEQRKNFAFGVFDPVFSASATRDSIKRPDNTQNLTSADAINQVRAQQTQINVIQANTLATQQDTLAREQLTQAFQIANNQQVTPFTVFPSITSPALDQRQVIIFDQDLDRYQTSLQARTPWGTRIALTAQQTRLRSTFIGDTRNVEPQFSALGQIEIVQPLLRGFGPAANLSDVRIARVNQRVAELAWRRRISDTVQAVMSAYYDMVYGLQDIRVREDAITADRRLVEQNQRRLELGFLSPLDVQQARVAVSNDEELLIRSKFFFIERQYQLKRLLAKTFKADDARVLIPTATRALAVPGLDRAGHMRTAFQNRYDYRAAITEAEVQDIRLRLARNLSLPQLDVVTSYGYNGLADSFGEARSQAFNSQAPQWSLGVQFSIPLGNVQARAQLKLVRDQQEQARLNIQRAEITVSVDVDTVISRIEYNRQSVETARQSRLAAEEAVRISNRRLEEGQVSSFDVIENRRKLYDSRSRELTAQADLQKSITLLWLATSTVLERAGIVFKE